MIHQGRANLARRWAVGVVELIAVLSHPHSSQNALREEGTHCL